MSKQISAIAESMFDATVKSVFQDIGKNLRETVRVKTGVIGSTYNFPLRGSGVAHKHVQYTDVVPMNIAYSQNTCTLSNYNASEYTDIFDKATVQSDEVRGVAVEIGNAINRALDQEIINAMTGSGYTKINTDVAVGTTGLTLTKMRAAKKAFDKKGVPSEGRFFLCGAAQLNDDLLATTEITSSDYNSVKALVQGEIDTFLGFKWKVVGDRDEGGLPLSSATRSCVAYHKEAVGVAIGIDASTTIDWIPEKRAWLASGDLKAGAVVIDAKGVILVLAKEA